MSQRLAPVLRAARLEAPPEEQVVEIPVPMQEEEIVHVPKIITQTRQVQQCLELCWCSRGARGGEK